MMKFAIVEDGRVINLAVSDQPLADNWIAFDGEVHIGDIFDGAGFSPAPPPVKSPEELQKEVIDAAQQRLDNFARSRGYDGILSLCTYAASAYPKFQAEGAYGVVARDGTWSKLYEILLEVQNGTRPVPSGYKDIEPELPMLTWP